MKGDFRALVEVCALLSANLVTKICQKKKAKKAR